MRTALDIEVAFRPDVLGVCAGVNEAAHAVIAGGVGERDAEFKQFAVVPESEFEHERNSDGCSGASGACGVERSGNSERAVQADAVDDRSVAAVLNA